MATQETVLLLMKFLHNWNVNSYLSIEHICEMFDGDIYGTIQMINLGEEMGYLEKDKKYCRIIQKWYKIGICMYYLKGRCKREIYCKNIHGQEEYDLITKLLGFECLACTDLQRRVNYMHSKYDKCKLELQSVKRELQSVKRELQSVKRGQRNYYQNVPRARVVKRTEELPSLESDRTEESSRSKKQRDYYRSISPSPSPSPPKSIVVRRTEKSPRLKRFKTEYN